MITSNESVTIKDSTNVIKVTVIGTKTNHFPHTWFCPGFQILQDSLVNDLSLSGLNRLIINYDISLTDR